MLNGLTVFVLLMPCNVKIRYPQGNNSNTKNYQKVCFVHRLIYLGLYWTLP